MKIFKLFILALTLIFIYSCGFDFEAFYRYGRSSDDRPEYFTNAFQIVSNIVQADDGSSYSLDIVAVDYEAIEDTEAYIDVVFWEDENNDDELNKYEYIALAISSDPDTSVFPLWISFRSDGVHDSHITPESWDAYSQNLVPVSYLDLSGVNIKPYEWEFFD